MRQFDLFPDDLAVESTDEGKPLHKGRRFSAGWQLSDHACRFCFGRVLQRVSKGEVIEVRCAECGERREGPVDALCACGAECGELGRALECMKNTAVTKEVPHEILVRERRVVRADSDAKALGARPVKMRDY